MKIVFWNINKNDLSSQLTLLSQHINPDILILAECEMDSTKVIDSLNNYGIYYEHIDIVCKKIKFFTKYNSSQVSNVTSDTRYTVKKISVTGYPSFNLMALHYPSKLNSSNRDQAAQASVLRSDIEGFENAGNSKNTILIGDFNMNPFEDAMVQNTGLHSVMSKAIAKKRQRTVDGRQYSYFYNPMWSFYGDKGRNNEVNGTYYLNSSSSITHFWHILDQVLVRPDLLDYFDEDELDIITKLGTLNLLNRNNFIDKNISDHLPITCTIKQ